MNISTKQSVCLFFHTQRHTETAELRVESRSIQPRYAATAYVIDMNLLYRKAREKKYMACLAREKEGSLYVYCFLVFPKGEREMYLHYNSYFCICT